MPKPMWKTLPKPSRGVPIRAVHGDADSLVPYGATETMVRALSKQHDVTLRKEVGVGHHVPPPMRAWLEQQWSRALRTQAALN